MVSREKSVGGIDAMLHMRVPIKACEFTERQLDGGIYVPRRLAENKKNGSNPPCTGGLIGKNSIQITLGCL